MIHWLANGLVGLINLIEGAVRDQAPITKTDVELFRHEIKRLTEIVERMTPQ